MSHYSYERLSALDNSFLVLESQDTPMHVASVAIFEGQPLRGADGGIDFERITRHVESRLHRIPRYRQRLMYIPFEDHPVWVDDHRFKLHYHLRHSSLPKPGDDRQLKRLCARIMSQQLDRGKPLWETWIVEGLQAGGVAMISKTHHCMIDGISGVDLLTVLLDTRPEIDPEEPVRWIPRPVPSRAILLRDEAFQRLGTPLSLLGRLVNEPGALFGDIRSGVSAVVETASAAVQLASPTPFNVPIGPHRRFDWMVTEITAIRAIRDRLGGTLNDVVLATVAGAVRRFLQRRNVPLEDLRFRVFVPVSLRARDERGTLGNRVSGWIVDLPVTEQQAVRRLERISAEIEQLKQSHQTQGTEILAELTEWTGTAILSLGARLASQVPPFNMVVTNVPGPPQFLYLLGARMLEAYPMVPLALNQALGIALFSNAGRLHWGFNADWDALPDLHDFVGDIARSFDELRSVEASRPARRSPRRQGGAPD